jgi:hypothetical protein
VFRTSARGGFYGCSNWKKHESQKWSVDLKDWEKDARSKPQAEAGAAPAADATTNPQPQTTNNQPAQPQRRDDEPPPITDNDIPFGLGADQNRGRGRR